MKAWQTESRRERYRFRAATVEVVAEDARAGRWFSEFVAPWFAPGSPDAAVASVRMRFCAESVARLEARRREVDGLAIECFNLDDGLVSCPGWTQPDGAMVAYDATFRCYYRLSGDACEITALPGQRQARMGLLRVVREAVIARSPVEDRLDLHAAAFVLRGRAVLVAGAKLAGKTTLLAHALASGEASLLANDRVMIAEGAQAHGIPTVISLREPTLRTFPALADGLPADAALLAREELPVRRSSAVTPGFPFRLSPAQFADRLGARLAACAPVAAVVFPEITQETRGLVLAPLAPEEGARRLRESLYARRSGPRQPTWFERQAGASPSAEAQAARSDELAARVPCHRCILGPDAYRDPARAWLASLPLAEKGPA
jgi:hypothetical protein